MQQQTRVYVFLLRFLAVLVAVVAVIVIAMPPDAFARNPRLGAWSGMVISLGAAAALMALASMMIRQNKAPADANAAYARLEQQLTQVHVKLNDLAMMSDRNSRAQNFATMAPGRDYGPAIEKLTTAVSELKELTLLSPEQRAQRIAAQGVVIKADRVKEVFAFVAAHDWARAERSLSVLEAEFPGDEEVARGRTYLDHARRVFEEETMVRSICEVEKLVDTGDWDEARRKSAQLAEGFPKSGDAQVLKQRVEHEYQFHRESTVRKIIEDIRTAVEHRQWQEAIAHSERLVGFYPEHQLVEGIRNQMPTMRQNLEIEQRQAIEIRLQSMIQDGHIEEAIELAEDTIRQYPSSPQARNLEAILPRLREMATEGVNEFAGFGHEAPNIFSDRTTIEPEAADEKRDERTA